MINYSSKYVSPDTLCRSKFPLITGFHDYLVSNDFTIDQDFTHHWFTHLTICRPTPEYILAPPILLIGRNSEQRELFSEATGQDWGRNIHKKARTPEPLLERMSAYGYEYAFENQVFCQECEAIIQHIDGPKYVAFQRAMWRYQDPGGKTLIAFLATRLNPTLQ